MSKIKRITLSDFISYMFVLLPLLVFSLVVMQLSSNYMEEKEKQEVKSKLYVLADDMTEWYQRHFENSVVLSLKSVINSGNVTEDSGIAAKAIAYLRDIKLFDAGIEDIFVYYGEGALYGAGGKTRPSVYFGKTFSCTQEDVKEAERLILDEEDGVLLLQSELAEGYLLYHFPVSGSGYQGYRAIHYVLPVSYWQEQAKLMFGEMPITLCLNVGTEKVYLLKNAKENESLGRNHIRLINETGSGDMDLELIYNVELSYQALRKIQVLNLCILVLGILLSAIVSISMSRQGSKKMQLFSKMVKNKEIMSPNGNVLTRKFDYIQEMLVSLLKENSQMDIEMKNWRQTMLNQSTRLLYHGLLNDNESVRQLFKELGRELFEEYYYLYALYFQRNEDARAFISELDENLFDYEVLEKGCAIIYMGELPALDPLGQQRTERAKHILKKAENIGTIVKLVNSQVYQDLSMAKYAYLEVSSILEHPENIREKIVCWEHYMWKPTEKVHQIPEELLEEFGSALEKQSFSEARETLAEIRRFISGNVSLPENQRYLCYCVLHALIVEVRKDEREDSQRLLNKLVQLEPVNEESFYKQMEYILQKWCGEGGTEQQLAKAVAYIGENYTRYDLSLDEVASIAGISKTHMSKLFKNKFGIRYIDYLTQLRMQKAKLMLEETQLSVKDILLEVGYIDKTNFSKKFKDYYGVNASAYRKQVWEQKENKE